MNDELAGFPIFSSPAPDENSGHCKSQGGGVALLLLLLLLLLLEMRARKKLSRIKKQSKRAPLIGFIHKSSSSSSFGLYYSLFFIKLRSLRLVGFFFLPSVHTHQKAKNIKTCVGEKRTPRCLRVDFFLFRKKKISLL